MKYYLIMDIGGTKTSAALFTENGEIVGNDIYTRESKTFSGEDAVYLNSKGALDHVLETHSVSLKDVLGIGVGCPGPLDAKNGVIIHAPLMRWKNFPLADRLKKDFGKPVAIDKDCNLGALAEQRMGLAKGLENVIYITVSTGVGAGILLNGQIYHGNADSAGEFGHISLYEDGLPCPCGNRGCLELYCSGTAIKRLMLEDAKRGVVSGALACGSSLDARALAFAAGEGDEYAVNLFHKIGTTLGMGIAIVFNLLAPDKVVIGGGVSKSHAYFHPALLETVKSRSITPVHDDRIAYSKLCDTVVLHGAYHLIKDFCEKGEKACR